MASSVVLPGCVLENLGNVPQGFRCRLARFELSVMGENLSVAGPDFSDRLLTVLYYLCRVSLCVGGWVCRVMDRRGF